jgi:hypothetical protein
MKCADFKSFLERALEFRSPSADDEAHAVQALFPILDTYATKKVADLAQAIMSAPTDHTPDAGVGQLSQFLRRLSRLMGNHAKSISTDLETIISALAEHPGSLETLSSRLAELKKPSKKARKPDLPVRDEIVARYLRRLEESLGDDQGFNEVFHTLEGDDVTGPEMILIAKRFSNAASRSRPAALKKIRMRHQAIIVDRAKSAATAGRIAG